MINWKFGRLSMKLLNFSLQCTANRHFNTNQLYKSVIQLNLFHIQNQFYFVPIKKLWKQNCNWTHLSSDLVTTLASLNMYDFSHFDILFFSFNVHKKFNSEQHTHWFALYAVCKQIEFEYSIETKFKLEWRPNDRHRIGYFRSVSLL